MMQSTDPTLISKKLYTGKHNQWDRFSSIRSRPRRHISMEINENYFPISRQPLCVHPIITALGEETMHFILTQSAYKFMYEIAMLETEMVNTAACRVANNRLPFDFPEAVRHDALTVIVDEAYHAFVAIDFMQQIEKKTGIKPIQMPHESPNSSAINLACANLPENLHDSFQLIAVCISEHTLTKELISVGEEGKALKSFSAIMADHVLDEGRHAMIFSDILAMFWQSFDKSTKEIIGSALPLFIKEYLNT
ncbi:MAG TPA: diiron oxygenase, partial [Gammaproteobacteria bacterium]|nr:diiron oxygenase [Gammaproteobacteria bacterium]